MTALLNEGRLAELETLFKIWTVRFPNYVLGWQALVALLMQLERSPAELLPTQKKIVELLPEDAKVHLHLGNNHLELGQLDDAAHSYRLALKIKPDFAEAHSNLGNLLRIFGRLNEAEASCRRALEINPGSAGAYCNLGAILLDLKQLDAAEACCRRAAEIEPDFADAHSNLGLILHALGRLDEAEASCRRALEIKPNFAGAYNNLGNTLHYLGRSGEAEVCFRRALEIKPDYTDAYSNLGVALDAQCRYYEAEVSIRQALEIKPDFAEAHSNLANTLKNLLRLDEAEASYRRTLEIKPDYEGAHGSLLFLLNYHPDKSGEDIFEDYRKYDAKFGQPHRVEWRPHNNSRETQRRLKIGYVSPDFKQHPMQNFLEPLLMHHDKNTVEVYAYAELAWEDKITARYKGYVDHWIYTKGLNDAALIERIRADGIDILIDLAGHTDSNRLGVFARKPAPVSASWMGYGYTTGLSAIDYFLTDEASAPADSENLFSETPWRLATPGYVYRPKEGMGEVSPLPALNAGYVTFGTLSRGIRINHRVIRVWSEILKRVKGARLIIDSGSFAEKYTQNILAEKFAVHGIHRDQLQIGFHTPPWDVLRGLDIGLDCFPHNSGTTILETLYMGVPFITLAERPTVGRIGSSALESVGHPEWIAKTEEEYVEKAVALAGDLPKLAALHAGLREEMKNREMMNEPAFARKVEAAYRGMFKKWTEKMDTEMCQKSNANMNNETLTTEQLRVSAQALAQSNIEYPHITQESLADSSANLQSKMTESTTRDKLAKKTTLHQDENPSPQDTQTLMTLLTTGQNAEAATLAQSMTERFPLYDFGWKVLGAIFQQIGRSEDALVPMQQAVALSPDDAEAHSNLGYTLLELGRLVEAETCFRQALEINPDLVEAHNNLGNTLKNMGQLDEAVDSFLRALDIKPNHAKALSNLSSTLNDLGRLDEAEESCRLALEIKPDLAEAHNNLGNTLKDMGRLDEAVASFLRVLEIIPNSAEAYNNLGDVLMSLLLQNDAETCFRRALEIKPNYEMAFNNLLFTLNYHPDKSAEEIFEDYRKYNVTFSLPHQSEWQPHNNSRETQRRLKVGYVSPDFKKHPVQHFLEPLLAHHDKQAVEVYAYADVAQEDSVTARYKNYVDQWIPTRGLSNATLAERIRADGIDILLDLAGHTAYNRLGVFARKPAPVSVSLFGYGYSTGLTAIDYYLADEFSVPSGCEKIFSERPWRIETPPCVYRPAEDMGEVNALPALERDYITFGTLSRAVRINYRTLHVWAELLKRVPRSRLVIDSRDFKHPAMQDQLAEKFAALGIGREQLEIGCNSPPWNILRKIDIGLDCFPHNSGTTLFENIYMGLPFVTLAGRPSVGCLGKALLEGLGHPEWVAGSEDEYIEIAVELASDLGRLAQLRTGLRDEMRASALMDEPAFARKMEKAFREMWTIRCEKGGQL